MQYTGHFVLMISLDLMKSSEVRIACDRSNYQFTDYIMEGTYQFFQFLCCNLGQFQIDSYR